MYHGKVDTNIGSPVVEDLYPKRVTKESTHSPIRGIDLQTRDFPEDPWYQTPAYLDQVHTQSCVLLNENSRILTLLDTG